MIFTKRSDAQSWLGSGGCPFYFHSLPPKCAITRMALGGKDIFEDDSEREIISALDCTGNMHICPYVEAMWDFGPIAEPIIQQPQAYDPVAPVEPPSAQNIRRASTLNIPEFNITLHVDDGPPNPANEALIIPTTRMGLWASLGQQHGWDRDTGTVIESELALYEKPLALGQVVQTKGWGSGHRTILHASIFDDVVGGGMTSSVIQTAIMNALDIVDNIGLESVEIRPMCIPLPGGDSLPDFWNTIAIPVTSIFSLVQAGRLSAIRRYRLDVFSAGLDVATSFIGSLSR